VPVLLDGAGSASKDEEEYARNGRLRLLSESGSSFIERITLNAGIGRGLPAIEDAARLVGVGAPTADRDPDDRGPGRAGGAQTGLEPIFEGDFLLVSYGFRPRRGAHDAVPEIQRYATKGYRWVLDADIEPALSPSRIAP
jgi:hypothetical protein